MILRNSGNSMLPSSSTFKMICSTFSVDSARPNPISGSSSSSIPILPPWSSSNALKHFLRFFSSSAVKSSALLLPLSQNHFLVIVL